MIFPYAYGTASTIRWCCCYLPSSREVIPETNYWSWMESKRPTM